MSESLNAQLADLHAERLRTWDSVKLQVNIDQRRELVDRFDPSRAVRAGDIVPPFTLTDSAGGTIHRDDLVADGLAVLIFFRFAGCPACNIALPYYQRTLWPALAAAGIPLVAISPQLPERVGAIRERHALDFRVASDPGNRLARQLGILFEANAATRAGGEGPGWIGEVVGTHSWELPQPAVIVLGAGGIVRFVSISPDWLVRTEAQAVLDAVRGRSEDDSGGVRQRLAASAG